ncbi:MAG: hypothetical protein O9284_15070 [Steroidobacteraceae bacterium]|jgi:hypothetical protein|nr:hypothetical protein [Steroidobacteraceae bacterium]
MTPKACDSSTSSQPPWGSSRGRYSASGGTVPNVAEQAVGRDQRPLAGAQLAREHALEIRRVEVREAVHGLAGCGCAFAQFVVRAGVQEDDVVVVGQRGHRDQAEQMAGGVVHRPVDAEEAARGALGVRVCRQHEVIVPRQLARGSERSQRGGACLDQRGLARQAEVARTAEVQERTAVGHHVRAARRFDAQVGHGRGVRIFVAGQTIRTYIR